MNKEGLTFMKEDEASLYTPQSKASSILKRRPCYDKMDKHLKLNSTDRIDGSRESLGILSLNSVNLAETNNLSESSSRLQLQQMLAKSTLNRRVSQLPSQFLRPSNSLSNSSAYKYAHSETTVSENDLLSFNPSEVSTPRSSEAQLESVSESLIQSESQMLAHISQQLKNSKYDFTSEISSFTSLVNQYKELNSLSFTSGELAKDKLIADELSWKNQMDIPGRKSDFSLLNDCNTSYYNDKVSVGDFFKQKSEDIKKIISANSPETRKQPVALIDNSNITFNEAKNSECCFDKNKNSMSVSEIIKVISTVEADTPTKIVDLLFNHGCNNRLSLASESNKENLNHSNKPLKLMDSSNISFTDESTKSCNVRSDEENINKIKDGTLNTIRSTSSLSNLPDGKIPIETNRVELVWGCIKIGKSQPREFIIRNRSRFRIKFQASITGSSFKILKDRSDSETSSSMKFMLRPMETRTIIVLFSPVSVGSALEKIFFTPIDSYLEQTHAQLIKLYGYGGHANMDMFDLAKDVTGKFLLSFGKIEDKDVFEQYFIVRNSGVLSGFALFSIECNGLYPTPKIEVYPNQFVLNSNEEQEICVKYIPKKEDFSNAQDKTSVFEIAHIKVIMGAEVTRGRIRRLYKKATAKGLDAHPLHKKISEQFDNECMPSDLIHFKETLTSIKELNQECITKEIIITAEDPECTFLVSMDDTTIFQTLCPNGSDMTVLENTAVRIEKKN